MMLPLATKPRPDAARAHLSCQAPRGTCTPAELKPRGKDTASTAASLPCSLGFLTHCLLHARVTSLFVTHSAFFVLRF